MKSENAGTSLFVKFIALLSLAVISVFSLKEVPGGESHAIDSRALVLVFFAPIALLFLFQRRPLGLGLLMGRMRQVFGFGTPALLQDLRNQTLAARGTYGYSHVIKMSETSKDATLRYAGEMFSARFSPTELAHLLGRRIQAEDAQWAHLGSALAFLAKMAPYFGMMATVVGMVKLLGNMSDFSKISGNMALAMQGTLYGLVSFLMLYAPLQRYVHELRQQIYKRNEAIARWFILIAEQADPIYIQNELHADTLSSSSAPSVQATESARRRA
jgi:biopolymer transport protein ExbB/TolQ